MFNKQGSEGYRQLAEGVRMKTLVHGEKTLMAEFRIDKGAKVPTHAHPHEQTGFMVSGTLRFNVDGKSFDAQPGDSWNIAGDKPHSAVALEDAVAVEVFSPVREDYLP